MNRPAHSGALLFAAVRRFRHLQLVKNVREDELEPFELLLPEARELLDFVESQLAYPPARVVPALSLDDAQLIERAHATKLVGLRLRVIT